MNALIRFCDARKISQILMEILPTISVSFGQVSEEECKLLTEDKCTHAQLTAQSIFTYPGIHS